jgi:fumarate hydratase class II
VSGPIANAALQSVRLLGDAAVSFADNAVAGIEPNARNTWCTKNACSCEALGALEEGPAPWHGSCQTWPNQ